MSWWVLLIFVTVVWLVGAFVDGAEQNCGVLPLPFLLIGAFFWIIAMAIDFFVPPWGTYIVAAFHGLLSLMIAWAIIVMAWHRKR
jgi:hypothetical protein